MKGEIEGTKSLFGYREMLHNHTLLEGMAQGVAKGSSYQVRVKSVCKLFTVEKGRRIAQSDADDESRN